MVEYEWVVETLESLDEDADIIAVEHWMTYARAVNWANEMVEGHYRIGLVRDTDRGGYHCRSWAYITDGKLPEFFTDACGWRTSDVPQRFHREVAR